MANLCPRYPFRIISSPLSASPICSASIARKAKARKKIRAGRYGGEDCDTTMKPQKKSHSVAMLILVWFLVAKSEKCWLPGAVLVLGHRLPSWSCS